MHEFNKTNISSRCLRSNDACRGLSTTQCKKIPLHITWQYMAIPKHVNISSSRTSIILFSLKGPSNANNHVQYELNVKEVLTDKEHVIPAVRSNFLIQKGNHINSAVVSLRDSLDGPQEIHLEMVLRLSINNNFQQMYVANMIVYVAEYSNHPHHLHTALHSRRKPSFFF